MTMYTCAVLFAALLLVNGKPMVQNNEITNNEVAKISGNGLFSVGFAKKVTLIAEKLAGYIDGLEASGSDDFSFDSESSLPPVSDQSLIDMEFSFDVSDVDEWLKVFSSEGSLPPVSDQSPRDMEFSFDVSDIDGWSDRSSEGSSLPPFSDQSPRDMEFSFDVSDVDGLGMSGEGSLPPVSDQSPRDMGFDASDVDGWLKNPPRSAFTAKLTTPLDSSPYTNQRIIFDSVLTSVGNDYNPTDGTFTTRTPGTYVFSLTLMSKYSSGNNAFGCVQKNNIEQICVWSNGNNANEMSSNTITLNLVKDDVVDVVLKAGTNYGLHNYGEAGYCSFSGFLLYPEI